MKKGFTSHSPSPEHYYYIGPKEIKLPKFEFEYPISCYGLVI